MRRAVRDRWVKALRSGEYQQTQGLLCRANGSMCCLGVLIDTEVEGVWELDPAGDAYKFDGLFGNLSDSVKKQLAIPVGVARSLAEMNDVRRASFARIADYIEANL